MMPTLAPSCQAALKEWATVLQAMARGEQLVLIRKGGLIEPGSGFELVANTFVLYPTFEHQAVKFLRPAYARYFDDALTRRAGEGCVRFDLCATAVFSKPSTDPAVVERLQAFHIYNGDFVQQRLHWQPEQPLVVAAVRVFRLASPQVRPVVAHYAGCKSWVTLEAPVSLEGAVPVVDETAFDRSVREIRAVLS